MRDDKILRAIGNIDEDLIERAVESAPTRVSADKGRKLRRLGWAASVAACLVIGVAIAVPALFGQSQIDGGGYTLGAGDAVDYGAHEAPVGGNVENSSTGSASGGSSAPSPSLSLDEEPMSEACYAALDDWRGLPTENYVFDEQSNGIVADRTLFATLDDLAAYADAFVVVPGVRKTSRDGDNMQTSIVEYAETIGDRITTRQWDDHTISTGARVLIRQRLIGGCTMDEPNNLLREGGVYLLPVKFNPDWIAYEVVGDFDVLFELNDEGKIVSHSIHEDFNQYDGKPFNELVDAVRALYSAFDAEFTEQPINTAEQAERQVIAAYNNSGFRKFSVEFDSETVISGADVYLFKVTFNGIGSEYAAVAKENGAFIRGELKSNGDIQVLGGLGGFPRQSD